MNIDGSVLKRRYWSLHFFFQSKRRIQRWSMSIARMISLTMKKYMLKNSNWILIFDIIFLILNSDITEKMVSYFIKLSVIFFFFWRPMIFLSFYNFLRFIFFEVKNFYRQIRCKERWLLFVPNKMNWVLM